LAACKPEISVAKLALEHGVNTNLLFKWRRDYRAGKYGAPGPTDLVAPITADLPVATTDRETAVTLLPVRAPAEADRTVTRTPCIEVVFAGATVRIRGVPEMTLLRTVLDCLARRS
jgi:transposase